MTAGRPKQFDAPIKKTLSLRSSIVRRVDERLYDPQLKGPEYGGWSDLIERLLQDWLNDTNLDDLME